MPWGHIHENQRASILCSIIWGSNRLREAGSIWQLCQKYSWLLRAFLLFSPKTLTCSFWLVEALFKEMLWHDLCHLLFGQYGETNASATSLASIVAEYREESWCLQEPSSESRFLHWLFGVIESRMMNPNAKSPFYEL